LIDALTKYQQQERSGDKKNHLSVMSHLAGQYLKQKEEDLLREKSKESFSCENIERAYRRIDACILLLKEI